ncbi:MAG: carbohydrate ABC transporter permease [Bacillota bacterium]|nr:carbohydrate ABC transporter permease [Bacillota bacterium]
MKKIAIYLFLVIVVVVSLFPFYLMFISSTLSTGEILSTPPKLFFGSNLSENMENLNSKINIFRVLLNSLFVSITYTFFSILFSSMAGFALAKYNFKFKKLIFIIVVMTLMIPQQVLLIPLFRMMTKIGWQNSYKAVIIPMLANAFGVFLMRQNMINFPTELLESGRIDGCGEIRLFFNIVLPTMRPTIGALGIYNFMGSWGSFMWPLIILSTKDMYTLPIALASLSGLMMKDYGMIMLGATIATLPIMVIFLIFQKQFISGIMGGALKG